MRCVGPVFLVQRMTVAAGGLLVAGAEVPEEAGVGVGRWVDRLAEDDLLVATRAAQQCETRCPEGNTANVGPAGSCHQVRLHAAS